MVTPHPKILHWQTKVSIWEKKKVVWWQPIHALTMFNVVYLCSFSEKLSMDLSEICIVRISVSIWNVHVIDIVFILCTISVTYTNYTIACHNLAVTFKGDKEPQLDTVTHFTLLLGTINVKIHHGHWTFPKFPIKISHITSVAIRYSKMIPWERSEVSTRVIWESRCLSVIW